MDEVAIHDCNPDIDSGNPGDRTYLSNFVFFSLANMVDEGYSITIDIENIILADFGKYFTKFYPFIHFGGIVTINGEGLAVVI